MIIENLDFDGSSDIAQLIQQETQQPSQPPQPPQPQGAFGPPPELQPEFQTRTVDQRELFKPEIKPPQIEMDFSTPIADIVPSAELDNYGPSSMGGPYKNPQNQKVVALSLDNATGGGDKAAPKNPFGLTDEQLNAVIAGLAATVAFSKPVQNKLADLIPKFMSDAGDLSATGMLATAFFAAVVFYVVTKFMKPQKK
jgi:hypothetical protein